MKEKTPNPGSKKAIEEGCICPVIDNRHGKGAYNKPDGQFYITVGCKIHDIKKIIKRQSTKKNKTKNKGL